MEELEKLKRLNLVNLEHLENYCRYLHMQNVRPRTIETKLWRVYTFLDRAVIQDAKTVQKKQIEDWLIERKKKHSPITVEGELLEVRLFYRWLLPDREKELFPYKMRRTKKTLPVERMVTIADLRKIVEACRTQRDRALVMFLWDSAARISEAMDLKIGNIQFDQYGAVVIVSGKTEQRRIRLTASVPDLQAWINQHPQRADPQAPLFVTLKEYGSATRKLATRTVQNSLKKIARRAGVDPSIVHPHAIRHSRCTDLVKQGFTEMELRMIAGWEKNSMMPEVYVHLSGRDIDAKILEKAGIVTADDAVGKENLNAIICPRCKGLNPPGSLYCSKCSMALTDDVIFKQQRINEIILEDSDIIIEWAQEKKKEKNNTKDMKKG